MSVKQESMPQSSQNGSAAASNLIRSDAVNAEAAGSSKPGISADEIALYDRQIRLWGLEAQERIRTSNVLLISMKGLANEVAKNLVLAGIGSLTIVDSGIVTEDDLAAQFFLREEHIGSNRAQSALPQIAELNPRVSIKIALLDDLFADTTVFQAYNLVIATDMSLADASLVNAACRVQGVPFYAAGTQGMYGYIFADLISHDFVISRQKSNVPAKLGAETSTRSILAVSSSRSTDGKSTELVTKREVYTPILLANSSPLPEAQLSSRRRKMNVTPILSCLRALWEYQSQTGLAMPPPNSRDDLALFTTLATNKHKELQLPPETLRSEVLRTFLANLGGEISPVCAFLGGQLAQDAINVIGRKEQPIQNMLIFDGEDFKAPIYTLNPALDLQAQAALPQMSAAGNGVDLSMLGGPPMDQTMAIMPPLGDPTMALVGDPSMAFANDSTMQSAGDPSLQQNGSEGQ